MAAITPEAICELFRTGNWSDLVIHARTEAFTVHRAIVCTASSVIAETCAQQDENAKRTSPMRIQLDEDPEQMGTLLAIIYGYPTLLDRDISALEKNGDLEKVGFIIRLTLQVVGPAGKYGASKVLKDKTFSIFIKASRVQFSPSCSLATFVELQKLCYETSAPYIRQRAAHSLAKIWKDLSNNEDVLGILRLNDAMFRVVKALAENPNLRVLEI